MGESGDQAQRHFSGAISRQIVGFVRERAGEEGVERLLALSGDSRPLSTLESVESWSTYDEARRLREVATEVVDDPFALRRIGETFVINMENSTEVTVLLQSLGSPAEVLRNIAQAAAKFSTAVEMRPLSVESSSAVIEAVEVPGLPRFQHLCDYTIGLLSVAPRLFGLPAADVLETECVLRGQDRCLFEVSWAAGEETLTASERELAQCRVQVEVLGSRFSTLHDAVRELVVASDVESVLQGIVRKAGVAVRAPKYLLALKPREDEGIVVHAEGLTGDAASRLAEEILASDGDEDATRLVVEVASVNRQYGRLAALYPIERAFFAEERHMLEQYAALAAVALDSAAALETARREAETAQALLRVARAVTSVDTTAHLAQRIAEVVPSVVDCDNVSFVVWDEREGVLRVEGTYGLPPELEQAARELTLKPEDTPVLARMIATPEPIVIDADSADPFLAALLAAFEVSAFLAVPVAKATHFFGAIIAAVKHDMGRLGRDRAATERLHGMADIAVQAFENARLLDEMRTQASHDPLTGLPNQRLLSDRVTTAIASRKRSLDYCALLFIDLDRFKNINDSLGHSAGDLLLREVGCRFAAVLREGDTVGRIGGDEFVVLLTQLAGPRDAEEVARRLLAALDEPIHVVGESIPVAASIGIAVAPEHGEDYGSLLQHADAAMYVAKRDGGRGHATYQAAAENLPNRMVLEAGLHRAIENGEIVAFFQPQFEMGTLKPVAAEALVRWHHPTAGTLAPDAFLPIARECGLTPAIDLRVLDLACKAVCDLAAAGCPIRIAVNFSPATMAVPGLVSSVESILRAHGVSVDDIEIEITEEAFADVGEMLVRGLADLKGLGLRVALDDFGTGQSSLSRIDPARIDAVKIDRSFVTSLSERHVVIEAIIAMAHMLGMAVVAEGVETRAQVEALQAAGCDFAQGFLFSRPVTLAVLEQTLVGSRS